MNVSKYIDTNYTYTDPSSYDARKQQPLERYLDSLWKPIIASIGKEYIEEHDVVCDFGCGTFAHYESMQQAQHIYAIDSNADMVTFGLQKITSEHRSNITPIISNATNTGLQNQTCSVVWSIGLTEYVDVNDLFAEMSRVARPNATLLLQFPNAYHPMHMIISFVSPLLGKKPKQFRKYADIATVAKQYGWNITRTYATGFYTPAPAFLIPFLIPVWKLWNRIGNNIFIVATKSTSK